MSSNAHLLLTPLAIANDHGYFICIAKRDLATQEIVEIAITSHDLAKKAKISLANAQRIFKAAQVAADYRLEAPMSTNICHGSGYQYAR